MSHALQLWNIRYKSWQHCVQTQAKVINIMYHCLPWIIHASFLLSHCQTSYMVSRGKKTKRHFIVAGLWTVPQVRVLNT